MKLTNGIPGSLQLKRGRYYYKYTFDGDNKPTMKAMIPPGQSRATDDVKTASELARLFYGARCGGQQDHDGTIGGVLKLYDEYCDDYYRDEDGPTAYRKTIGYCLKMFRVVEGNKLSDNYTSLDLSDFRDRMVKAPKNEKDQAPKFCRKEINRRINEITKFFKWAEYKHLIPANTSAPMIVMPKLKPGFMGVVDRPKVRPVTAETVDITCNYAPPVIRDMIRIMQLTGMRPKEMCALTPLQIDRSDDIWMIDFGKHKTAYLDKDRWVFFGPEAQTILKPYLLRDQDAFIFSPREAQNQRAEERRRSRITPTHWGTPPKGLNKSIRAFYTTQTFRKAVVSAIRKAQIAGEKIEHWFPYQLRHAFGTMMDRVFGIETSAAAMGNNIDTAKIYIEKRKEFARKAAKKCG